MYNFPLHLFEVLYNSTAKRFQNFSWNVSAVLTGAGGDKQVDWLGFVTQKNDKPEGAEDC